MNGNWRGYGFKNDNSYTTTKFISTVEADGKDEFLNYLPKKGGNKPSYSPKDYFAEGDAAGPNTYPNTGRYDLYGNASIPTGILMEVEEQKKDGTMVIRLSYEEPKEQLELTEISPLPCIVPYEGEAEKLPEDTKEIIFSYSKKIKASDKDLNKIKVVSDQKKMKGVKAWVEDNKLILSFTEEMKEGHAYTVIIPQGILKAEGDEKIINNYNGIYGFIK